MQIQQSNQILLLHPDLDCTGGIPRDEVVAMDDLIRTISVLSFVTLRHHDLVTLVSAVTSLYLFALGLLSPTYTEELATGWQ